MTQYRQLTGAILILDLISLDIVGLHCENWYPKHRLLAGPGRPWLHPQVSPLIGSGNKCNWIVYFPANRVWGSICTWACQIEAKIFVMSGICPHAIN
jgi:hypothetical protein